MAMVGAGRGIYGTPFNAFTGGTGAGGGSQGVQVNRDAYGRPEQAFSGSFDPATGNPLLNELGGFTAASGPGDSGPPTSPTNPNPGLPPAPKGPTPDPLVPPFGEGLSGRVGVGYPQSVRDALGLDPPRTQYPAEPVPSYPGGPPPSSQPPASQPTAPGQPDPDFLNPFDPVPTQRIGQVPVFREGPGGRLPSGRTPGELAPPGTPESPIGTPDPNYPGGYRPATRAPEFQTPPSPPDYVFNPPPSSITKPGAPVPPSIPNEYGQPPGLGPPAGTPGGLNPPGIGILPASGPSDNPGLGIWQPDSPLGWVPGAVGAPMNMLEQAMLGGFAMIDGRTPRFVRDATNNNEENVNFDDLRRWRPQHPLLDQIGGGQVPGGFPNQVPATNGGSYLGRTGGYDWWMDEQHPRTNVPIPQDNGPPVSPW